MRSFLSGRCCRGLVLAGRSVLVGDVAWATRRKLLKLDSHRCRSCQPLPSTHTTRAHMSTHGEVSKSVLFLRQMEVWPAPLSVMRSAA